MRRMKIPKNVKPKNFFFNLFPFSKYTAMAIYPNIYFTKEAFQSLISNNPSPDYIAALKHEQTHIERQRTMGWFKWGILYIFSSQFRFNEELAAIKSTMKQFKKEGLVFDIDKRARHLSNWTYLWCITYDEAKFKLHDAWSKINNPT